MNVNTRDPARSSALFAVGALVGTLGAYRSSSTEAAIASTLSTLIAQSRGGYGLVVIIVGFVGGAATIFVGG